MSNDVVPFGNRTPSRAPIAAVSGERTLPHSPQAEQGLLASILMDNRAYDRVADFLKPEHFAVDAHREIFGLIQKLIETGMVASPATLGPYLTMCESVEQAGGIKYLVGLLKSAVTVVNATDYGRQIHDLAIHRDLIVLGERITTAGYTVDPEVSGQQLIDGIETELAQLSDLGASEDTIKTMAQAVDEAMQMAEAAHRRGGGVIGTPTGLTALDARLAGLHPSDLIVLAGATSMGKTSLATRIAYGAAKHFRDTDGEDRGKFVIFFSLEMSGQQLATRIQSAAAQLDHHKIRAGGLNQEQWERLMAGRGDISALPIVIDQAGSPTVNAIRVRVRRMERKLKAKCGLVVIDYLQLIAPPPGLENRVQQVASITRGLKALAKKQHVPVLALSQLSRKIEDRDDKRPQLSDLRESGSIEQDSDVVMFVFREQYYLERHPPQQRAEENDERYSERQGKYQNRLEAAIGVADVIVAKQRHGPVGTVKLSFSEAYAWFDNYQHGYAENPSPAPSGAVQAQPSFDLF